MRVLILGASGFLGRHVHALLAGDERFEVKVGPRSRDLDLTHASHTVWRKVLQDAEPQAVVNCAGLTHGSFEDLLQANVSLVDHLIRAAQDQRRPPRIVHLGSAAEYGPDAQVAAETTPALPTGSYGESKLAGTQALLGALPHLHVHVLRVFNPIGPGQGAHTLPGAAARQFLRARTERLSQVEFGDLSPERDFVDVRDVAGAVRTVLLDPSAGELLNVGRGEAVSARSLVQALARLAGFTGRITERAAGSARSAGLSSQRADVTRLTTLGWHPSTSIESAVEALWQDMSTPVQFHHSSL
jgi:NDP-hexose 4-ketoreductase